jgi:hypothetical protein
MTVNTEAANYLLANQFKHGNSEAAWIEAELREFQGRLRRLVEQDSASRVADLREMRPRLQKLVSFIRSESENALWLANALAIIPAEQAKQEETVDA